MCFILLSCLLKIAWVIPMVFLLVLFIANVKDSVSVKLLQGPYTVSQKS